jgi:hypothetical protein
MTATDNNEAEVLAPEPSVPVLFSETRAKLAAMRAENDTIVFDLKTPVGMTDAKAHVKKTNKVKIALEKERKIQKAGALALGRAVDAQAQEIEDQVVEMLLVWKVPIEEIEQAAADRIAAHRAVLAGLEDLAVMVNDGVPRGSDEIEAIIGGMGGWVGEGLEEFQEEGEALYANAMGLLGEYLDRVKAQETKDAEFERMQRESQERDRADEERKLADEQQEVARKNAAIELEAERLKVAADRAQLEQDAKDAKNAAIDAEERRKQDLIDAEDQRAQNRKDAEQALVDAAENAKAAAANARQELLDEQKAEADAEEARIEAEKAADKAEKERIANDQKAQAEKAERESDQRAKAIKAVKVYAMDDNFAKELINTIILGEIPHVSFTYTEE